MQSIDYGIFIGVLFRIQQRIFRNSFNRSMNLRCHIICLILTVFCNQIHLIFKNHRNKKRDIYHTENQINKAEFYCNFLHISFFALNENFYYIFCFIFILYFIEFTRYIFFSNSAMCFLFSADSIKKIM